MTRIVLDAATRGKLLDLKEPLQLCDARGIIPAEVVPVLNSAEWEPVEPPPLSEEEEARIMEGPDYSTAEVLKYLESL